MSDRSRVDLVASLGAIDLDELNAIAELQTRRDRKYVVDPRNLDDLLARVPLRVLDIGGTRTFRYQSVYFDTADSASYLLAARRRPRRVKVRTRSYLDTAQCMLEVKTRDARGRTVKHRTPHPAHQADLLSDAARHFVRSIDGVTIDVDRLEPTLTTTYRRTTLVLDGAQARVTIDADLAWRRGDETLELPGRALIETKTSGPPCVFDRLLWSTGCRPVTVSKYCTALAAFRPTLPANKWARVLRTHFVDREASVA